MSLDITAFFHAPSSTYSYVVADDAAKRAAVIDPVLDYDAASGRSGTASAQKLVDHVKGRGYVLDWILETHAHADHLSAAQFLKQQTVGQGKFPRYKELELGPENVLGTRGALWRFDWTNPKTGRQMRVDDMLFVLQTPNGPQSYAIFMTAPDGNAAGSWNATILPIIANMLQSFKETTS